MDEGVGREEREGKVGKRGEEERRRGERKLGGTEIKSLEPLMHSKLPTTYGLPVHARNTIHTNSATTSLQAIASLLLTRDAQKSGSVIGANIYRQSAIVTEILDGRTRKTVADNPTLGKLSEFVEVRERGEGEG